jgi:hypothetical protein
MELDTTPQVACTVDGIEQRLQLDAASQAWSITPL